VQLDPPRHFYVHSIESIEILGNQSGLSLYKVIYDSTSFQFWGSEQYRHDIPYLSRRSYAVSPFLFIFFYPIMKQYRLAAEQLNKEKLGDQIAVLLVKR